MTHKDIIAPILSFLLATILLLDPSVVTKPLIAEDPPTIKGYHNWTKVNPKPYRVYSRFAVLCRNMNSDEIKLDKTDPHKDKFITVYINAIGEKSKLHTKTPVYPVCTVIVKEKHPDVKSKKPELLTVTRKRSAGFDKGNGDWEYLVYAGNDPVKPLKNEPKRCKSYHVAFKDLDYVSRSYLPDIFLNKLK